MDQEGSSRWGRGKAPLVKAGGGMGRGGAPLAPANLGSGRRPLAPTGSGRAVPIAHLVTSSSSAQRRGVLTPLGRDSTGRLTLNRDSKGQTTTGRERGQPTVTDCTTHWQLQKVIQICNNRNAGGNHVAGAVVTSMKLSKTEASEGEVVDGTVLCRRDTPGLEELCCSFYVVKQEAAARAIFECAISATHGRNLKAYFYAFLDQFDAYVVCFERFETFLSTVPTRDILGDSPETKGRLERHWVSNIREIFQCLAVLNKAGYKHAKLDRLDSFCYASQENGETKLKIKNAFEIIDKRNGDFDRVKHHQHLQFLRFLETQGAERILEYLSFQYFIEKSTNMELILKHPFILENIKERVLSIVCTNEVLFHMHEAQLNIVEGLLAKKLEGLDWRSTVEANKAMFGNFAANVKNEYESSFFELTRFLRNYVEHERDANPKHHVTYDTLHRTISKLFPGFICWVYTFAHAIY